jgi:hypothetical protein
VSLRDRVTHAVFMPRGGEELTASRPSRRLHDSPAVPWACRTAVGARLRLEREPQPPTSAPDMPWLRVFRVTTLLAEGASRGVTGQGPRAHGPRRFPRDRSRRELYPNPIGSDTSCRELAATTAGEAVTDELAGRAGFRRLAAGSPACAGLSGPEPMRAARAASWARAEGRFPRFLAKGTGIRCTRGAFHR